MAAVLLPSFHYACAASIALGQATTAGVTATITPDANETGNLNLYIGAVYKGQLFLRNGSNDNFLPLGAGALPLAGTIAAKGAQPISVGVTKADVSSLIGLDLYVAYGAGEADISRAGHLVKLYTVMATTTGTDTGKNSIAAAPFSSVLQTSYNPSTITAATSLVTRGRYLIADAATVSSASNYLSIGSNYNATTGYTVESATIASPSTYDTYLSKLVQLVADASDPACYRINSHLHPNDAIDADATDGNKLKFRNNFGKAAVAYGYVCFSYDSSSRLLQAKKRYNYSTTTYSHTADSSFSAANFYVKFQNGGYSLVSSQSDATPLTFYNSPLDFSVPNDFNPARTAYVSNAAAAFKTKDTTVDVSRASASYRAQLAATGSNAATKTAADAMLATIKNSLAAGESLRYDTSVYSAFRDGLLASTLKSDAIADGTPGQNLVPYVFFTNEKDASGSYHPYMVIVSYGNPGSPHGLLDVPRPPGDGLGTGGYPTQSVTRYANLDRYLIGIPMKNYGQVSSVTDNASVLPKTLWDDVPGTTAAKDTYSYASTADNGILISGAVMFPVFNNVLVPSQGAGELTASGCHVGQGGGGPHCHADGYASGNILGTYNDNDYSGKTHPPLIGFGYDGIALFGRYRDSNDSALQGFAEPLDAWGGHSHGDLGYHYHANNKVTWALNGSSNFTIRSLIVGAYKGRLTSAPYFVGVQVRNSPYLGGL